MFRTLIEVQADAGNCALRLFDQDATDFATSNEHVVRPLDPRLQASEFTDRSPNRHSSPGGEQSWPAQRWRREKQDGKQDATAGRGLPSTAMLAAAGGLLASHDDQSIVAGVICLRRGVSVRAVQPVE